MSKQLATMPEKNLVALEKVLIQGDLAPLSPEQRLDYVNKVAKAIGINPLLRPFDYITYHGKTVLYANRACTEQLRMKYHVSIKIASRVKENDLYIVTAQAVTNKGKTDEAIGAVSIRGLTGENLANALMKAETKAKRRVTLSICGLGIIDEIEARDFAEREVKAADAQTAANVQEKIEGSTARPEFETATPEIIHDPPAPPSPAAPAPYILKSGIHRGKKISQLTQNQINTFLKHYGKMTKIEKVHPDVESDYQAILKYMDESKLAQEESAGGSDKKE